MSGASQRASDQCGVTGEVVILASTRRVAAGASDVGHAEGELGTRLTLTPLVLLLAGKSIDAMLSEDHAELAFFAVWAVRGRRGPACQARLARGPPADRHASRSVAAGRGACHLCCAPRAVGRVFFGLLAARGLAVSEPQCVKIRACTDPAQLDAWIVRAATASTAGEALGEES